MNKIAVIILLFLASCSNKDEQFCTCLSEGEKLNEYTQQFFDKVPSIEEREELNKLKSAKISACKDYQTMGGDEMKAKKEACAN